MVRRCLCKRSTLSPEGVIGTSSIPFCGLMSEFRAGPCPVASISTTLGRYLRMNRQTAERDSRWVACSRHWSSNTCTPSLGHHAWITVKLFLGPPICVLLLESLKARLLRITQSSDVGFRERVRAQQLALLASPNFAVPEIVLAAARSDQWQLEASSRPFAKRDRTDRFR